MESAGLVVESPTTVMPARTPAVNPLNESSNTTHLDDGMSNVRAPAIAIGVGLGVAEVLGREDAVEE